MDNNLYRVESAVSATSSGDLTWERWTLDCAMALGFSGQRNPLGFALVRYLADPPSARAVMDVELKLATEIQRRGVAVANITAAARKAFDFWRDTRCHQCHGRGHIGEAHVQCPSCGGTGERKMPDGPEDVRTAISALVEAEQWMEGQLRSRLKGSVFKADGDGAKVNLPYRDGQDELGFNRSSRTPIRKTGSRGG